MEWEELRLLEERIEKILQGYLRLKEERDRLLELLKERDEEIAGLRKEVEVLKGERHEVRSRVERLIERLQAAPLE